LVCEISEAIAVLIALVERAIEAGASEMEVEYKDGWEEIYAVGSGIGVSIARLGATSAEARALRNELHAIPKEGQIVQACWCAYRLQVRVYESIGEDAFRVAMKRS